MSVKSDAATKLPPPKAKILIDRMEYITDHIELIGNIGAGKSLFVDRMNHYLLNKDLLATTSAVIEPSSSSSSGYDLIVTLKEPSDDCSQPIHNNLKRGEAVINDSENKSLLQLFYDDPEKNGFLFQVNAFTSRLEKMSKFFCKCQIFLH